MGNRAVITTAPYNENNVGIYVHWNGDLASVEGFLLACQHLGYRDPSEDPAYAMARLTQAIGTFFGGALSVGIGVVSQLDTDNGDNGTYVIGEGWQIVDRLFADADSDEIDGAQSARIADNIIDRVKAAQKVPFA